MSDFLRKFKELFLKGDFLPSGGHDNRREFPRFETNHTPHVYLLMEGSSSPLSIENISYGGFSVLCPREILDRARNLDGVLRGEIVCFHLRQSFYLGVVDGRGDRCGLQIVHDDMSGLLWLRGILEYFRIGLALTLYEGPNQSGTTRVSRYRGPSSTDLQITRVAEDRIERLDLSFQDQGITCKVEFLDGDLVYRRFDDLDDDSFLALEKSFFMVTGLFQSRRVRGLEPVISRFQDEIQRIIDSDKPSKGA